jgi:hypothetical protein
MKNRVFEGCATALITPMLKDGKVDFPRLEKLVDDQIAKGIDGLVICGTTGEKSTLRYDEHLKVIEESVKAANGRVPIIAGTGSNDTVYSVELCRGESKKFNVTPNEARDILITIYNMMNNFEDNVCLPFELFNNEKIVSLNKFISEVTSNCKAWSFFDSKNILDYDSQLGYTEHNFLEKFKSKKEECIKLIKFYETDQAESDGELDE